MGRKNEPKREPDRVKHDIGIPELDNEREYDILKLGIIIATEHGIEAMKMTTTSTLKFIDKLIKELKK